MKSNLTFIALIIAAAFLAGGCATASRVETDYGTSYKLAKFNQTLNPEAENNLDPVYGMDGKSAGNITDKYQKSFEKPIPAPTFSITIPGMGGN